MDILKSLDEIEDLVEKAKKMMDWGEYSGDHNGFWEARLAMHEAISKLANIRKALKAHEPIVQEQV